LRLLFPFTSVLPLLFFSRLPDACPHSGDDLFFYSPSFLLRVSMMAFPLESHTPKLFSNCRLPPPPPLVAIVQWSATPPPPRTWKHFFRISFPSGGMTFLFSLFFGFFENAPSCRNVCIAGRIFFFPPPRPFNTRSELYLPPHGSSGTPLPNEVFPPPPPITGGSPFAKLLSSLKLGKSFWAPYLALTPPCTA